MTPHIRGPGQRRWRTDALVVCGSSVSCLLACWLTARPGAAVGDTLTALALGRLLATELFRLGRLRLGRWGFQDGLTWVIAAVSGSLLSGLGGVSAGFDLSPRILVVDLFVFAAIGLTADAGLKLHLTRKAAGLTRKPAFVYGVGPSQLALLHSLRLNPESGFEPFGFLDDDPSYIEAILDGVPVLGSLNALPFLAELHDVRQVLAVQDGLSDDDRERLLDLAAQGQVSVKLLPE